MKLFNFPIDHLKKGWGNEFSPPHLPSVMLVIWHVLRLPFSLFHFRPSGFRVSDAALSRGEHKITRLYEQGTSKRRTGLALARWLGWGSLFLVPPALAASHCGGVNNYSGQTTQGYPALYADSQCNAQNGNPRVPVVSIDPSSQLRATYEWTSTLTPVVTNTNTMGFEQTPKIVQGQCYNSLYPPSGTWQTGFQSNTSYCAFFPTSTSLITLDFHTGSFTSSPWSGTFTLMYQPIRLTVSRTGTGSGTVVGSNIDCGSDCDGDAQLGSNYTLSATPTSNSTFVGWTGGNCSGTGTCQVSVYSDISIFARFDSNNSPPFFTSSPTATVAENQTSVLTVEATDPDGDTISYSVSGGADSASFSIGESSGVLTFNTVPDFETKSSYTVVVSATDNTLTATETITVTVTDVYEGPVSPPPITSPVPDSPLTGDTETITWTTSQGATNYWVQVGSSAGRNDIHDSGELDSTATSELVVNLPTNGSSVYVTIWYKDAEGWKHDDSIEFTTFNDGGASGSATPPTISSHTAGDTFTTATETFTWSDVGATNYWLQIGSSAGRNDHYDSGQLASTTTSQTVSDLPTDGNSVHVRIWYKSNGSWEYIPDTSYTAATVAGSAEPTPPTMTSPSDDTHLDTPTKTFAWSADGATKYWLQIGTSAGRNDYYDSSELDAATDNASGLPINGSKIYVRVWALIGGKWLYDDIIYNNSEPVA